MTKFKGAPEKDYRPRLDFNEIHFLLYALRTLQEKCMKECQLRRRLEWEERKLREKAKMGCVPEFFVWRKLQTNLRKQNPGEHNLSMINDICLDLIHRLEAMLEGRVIHPRWLPQSFLLELFSGTKNV